MKHLLLLTSVFLSLGLWSQVPSYVPQYGLLSYFPFNGNTNDVSANAANLTNNNAVLTADRFGTANAAYSFNGINQNLINSTPNFTFNPTSSFTYSFWYNRNSTATNGVLMMNATNAAETLFGFFKRERQIHSSERTNNNSLGFGHQHLPQQVFGHTSFVSIMQGQ